MHTQNSLYLSFPSLDHHVTLSTPYSLAKLLLTFEPQSSLSTWLSFDIDTSTSTVVSPSPSTPINAFLLTPSHCSQSFPATSFHNKSLLFSSIFPFDMASIYHLATLSLFCFIHLSFSELVQEQPLVLKYHNGPLLKGKISVNLIWYGKFTPIQRSIIVDFINSLSSYKATLPSTASWWTITEKYKGGEIGRASCRERV